METIYQGQTKLKITCIVGEDVTNATCVIKYIKPSGRRGTWNASIDNALTGTISKSILPAETDLLIELGTWTAWGYATYPDGRVIAGEPDYFEVVREGERPTA